MLTDFVVYAERMHIVLGQCPHRQKVYSSDWPLIPCLHCVDSRHHNAKAESTNAIRSDASNRRRRSSSPPYAFRCTSTSTGTSDANGRNDARGHITISAGTL